jgi:hypothetical protein
MVFNILGLAPFTFVEQVAILEAVSHNDAAAQLA